MGGWLPLEGLSSAGDYLECAVRHPKSLEFITILISATTGLSGHGYAAFDRFVRAVGREEQASATSLLTAEPRSGPSKSRAYRTERPAALGSGLETVSPAP